MHQLHLVGFTADHDGLIFSTKRDATSGAYVVTIDDALFSALEEARRAAMFEPDDASSQATADRVKALRATQRSSLSVRDIQSRLRTGVTLADIAREAGVDEDWVARFAPPVLAEQAAVVERALPLTFSTTRKGPSSRSLGDAVRWNLIDRRIDAEAGPGAEGWSAFQLEPGQWAVRFSYASRGRQQVAEWEVDFDAAELVARNRLASELGHVEAGARRRQVESASPSPASPAPPARKPTTGPPAKKATTGTPAKKATTGTPAKKATTGKPARKATTGTPARKAAPALPAKKATTGRQGRPARTETARAQAATATSSKAAAARAKSGPSPRPAKGSSASKRSGAVSAAESRRRSAPAPAPASASGPARRSGDASRSGADAAVTERQQQPPLAGDDARFPAPRPAAARRAATGPPAAPSPARPASAGSARPVVRASAGSGRPAARPPEPPPASPQSPAGRRRIGTQPSPRPTQSPPSQRTARPTTAPSTPAEPLVRRVAPPERQSSPRRVTADAKPMPVALAPAPTPAPTPPSTPAPGPAPTPTPVPSGQGRPTMPPRSTVRRLPSPSSVAAAGAAEPVNPVPRPEPAPEPAPEPPTTVPETQAQPSPPPPVPANVRPVGGGDGRPTILIIDAERASDRRRS